MKIIWEKKFFFKERINKNVFSEKRIDVGNSPE